MRGAVPRGTRTRLIASPSGMLCTAMARPMRIPRFSSTPKATPDADTLREGVDRHDPDDQERLRRVGSLQRPQMQRLVGVDDSLRDEDEDRAGKDADDGALRSVPGSLDDETEARTEHQPGSEAVRGPEPVAPRTAAKKNGSAPRPVANAVSSATAKTVRTSIV